MQTHNVHLPRAVFVSSSRRVSAPFCLKLFKAHTTLNSSLLVRVFEHSVRTYVRDMRSAAAAAEQAHSTCIMSALTGKFDCRLCDKPFKTRLALARHEASDRHQQAVIDAETFDQPSSGCDALDAVRTHPRSHATVSAPRHPNSALSAAPQQPTDPLSVELGSRLTEEDTSGAIDNPALQQSGAHAAEPVAPVRPHKASRLAYQHSSAHLPVSKAVAPLLPLLCNLSAADRELMFKVLHHPEFSTKDIPWKSVDELHSFLDKRQVSLLGCFCAHLAMLPWLCDGFL